MPAPRPDPAPGSARTIVLAGREIPYCLRRSRRRTIGLSIDHRGLTVGAPERASLGAIESLLRDHGPWVLDKLDGWRRREPPPTLAIADGLRLPHLGGELTVRLAVGANRAVWSADASQLTLCLAGGAAAAPVLERALRQRAQKYFTRRLAQLAPHLGVEPPPLALSSARTRWGSCSSRGGIRLNWRLVFLPPAVVDYVVAHELAHLREMNHSRQFWSLVEQLCPDWRERRLELRRLGAALPIF